MVTTRRCEIVVIEKSWKDDDGKPYNEYDEELALRAFNFTDDEINGLQYLLGNESALKASLSGVNMISKK